VTADDYARAIIVEGQAQGVSPRGIQIALATVYVESNFTMYANAKVPDSMSIPHDAVGSDGFSVGLFQQQVVMGANGWWWGDAATCMDPTLSAGLFYSRLAALDYNNPAYTPGSYAQDVQGSAYPLRYDQRFGDAVTLYNRLTLPPPPPEAPVNPPAFNYQNWVGRCPNYQDRGGTPIDLVLLHTNEPGTDPNAPDITSAEDLANFLIGTAGGPNPVSYHRVIDNAVNVIDVVAIPEACWAVMNSNNRSINMCFAGSEVAWTRDEWLSNMGAAIDVSAYLTVLDCHAWGIPTVVQGLPYHSDPPTIADHRYCSEWLQDGNTHVDVGDNFPWDVFAAAVAKYAGQPVAPPPPPPVPAPAPARRTYVVQPGDSISGIAAQFNITVDALIGANPAVINPNFIEVGQTLVIP
jgi:hypothetical protein